MKQYRIVAIILSIYAAIELSDCIALLFMQMGLLQNPYPVMSFAEFETLFNQQPIVFLPIFLFFTFLRTASAIGLFRQREWAFWTTVLVCTTTLLWVPFLMPFTGFEMLLNGIILFFLLLARFGKQPLLKELS